VHNHILGMSREQLVHDWVALRICQGLDFRLEAQQPPTPNSIVFKNAPLIALWAKDQGPSCLFAGLAKLKRPVGGHSFQVVLGFSPPSDCDGKLMYFMRMVSTELSIQLLSSDSNVVCGELPNNVSNIAEVVHEQLEHIMMPFIQVHHTGRWFLLEFDT
jgi:hypothetical protein